MTQKQKREAADAAWFKEHNAALLRCDSFGRIDYLLSCVPSGRPRTAWFRLLGEWWTMCDGMKWRRGIVASYLERASRQQLDAMMSSEELQELAKLPETIRAFRGCDISDRRGISFSLCEQVARRFPFLNRYRARNPALIVANIAKSRAVLKLERDERELIACGPVAIVSVDSVRRSAEEEAADPFSKIFETQQAGAREVVDSQQLSISEQLFRLGMLGDRPNL